MTICDNCNNVTQTNIVQYKLQIPYKIYLISLVPK